MEKVFDLRDMINDAEMTAFEEYVDAHASEYYGKRTVSGRELLHFWADAKNKYLYKLLGEKLIVSKTVTFEKESGQMRREMNDLIDEHPFMREFIDKIQNKFWMDFIQCNSNCEMEKRSLYESICSVCSISGLIDNVYMDDTFMVLTPEGKELKIQHGCKTMKALGKLASAYGLDMNDFEDFRIRVSQILNQKTLRGNLCLSIHPLDYVTMSDNNSDWSSCMSWMDNGCYRQGTVEMMNSPMVVVAYLTASEPMDVCDLEWNNKKWRELMIVNKDLITNIKSYPYFNSNLTKAALGLLRELAAKNTPEWNFDDVLREYEPQEPVYADDCRLIVYPSSDAMYNDFLNDPYMNAAYFNKDLYRAMKDEDDYERISFNYSGESECMGCGQAADFYDNEGHLMGECCDAVVFCSVCGESYRSEEELTSIDGRLLCSDCFEDEASQDAITGEYHLNRNLTPIRLISEKDGTKIVETISVYDVEASCTAKYFKVIRKREILNRFYEEPYYYVYASDCTNEGLALFGINDKEDDLDTTWMPSMSEEYQKVDDELIIDTPHDWNQFHRARNLLDRGDFFSAGYRIGDIAMAL